MIMYLLLNRVWGTYEYFQICFVERHTGLGSRPPSASQVQRDGRRPAQRQQGFLLLARGLADAAQTPRRLQKGQDHRHVRHQRRSTRAVSHQVSARGNKIHIPKVIAGTNFWVGVGG